KAEHNRKSAKAANTPKHRRAYAALQWAIRQEYSHGRSTHSWSSPQQSEPPGPGMENFACINREQRHGSSQQNSEKIQRDRTQYYFLLFDIAESGKNCGEANRLSYSSHYVWPNQRGANNCDSSRCYSGSIYGGRSVESRINESAD